MKAVVFSEHGGPEVLRYTEVAEPKIGPTEVLVRVRACALNHLDLWVRRGLPGITIPLPHIPGSDIAGEVARAGELVTHVKVGQRVLLAPGLSCGVCAACSAGNDNQCRRYTIFGYMVDGGCAEFVKSPGVNVIYIPGDLSFEEAAAVPLVFLTAWHMLIGRAHLQPGEDVYPSDIPPEEHHESFFRHATFQFRSHPGTHKFHFLQRAIQHGNLLEGAHRWIDLRKPRHRDSGRLKLSDAHASNGIFLAAHGAVGVDGQGDSAVRDGPPPLPHLLQRVILGGSPGQQRR